MKNTDDTPMFQGYPVPKYPSTWAGDGCENLPFCKGTFIPQLLLNHFMPGKKKTRTMRMAAIVIPWVREVMEVGEELSSQQIIGRIKTHNAPATGTELMLGAERKHTRNLRNLPSANSLTYMLSTSGEYERVKSSKVTTWRRVV